MGPAGPSRRGSLQQQTFCINRIGIFRALSEESSAPIFPGVFVTPHPARTVLKSSLDHSHRPLRLRAIRSGAAAALFAALWVVAPADVGAQKLNEALGVRNNATDTGAASQERINKVSDDTDELLRLYRDETAQIEALRVYNAQLEKLLASQEEEESSLTEQIGNVTVISREVTPLMLSMVDAIDTFIVREQVEIIEFFIGIAFAKLPNALRPGVFLISCDFFRQIHAL